MEELATRKTDAFDNYIMRRAAFRALLDKATADLEAGQIPDELFVVKVQRIFHQPVLLSPPLTGPSDDWLFGDIRSPSSTARPTCRSTLYAER